MSQETKPITQLLASAGRGDQSAREKLWLLIYEELRGMARREMAHEAAGRTLQPTALVHEAYFRLIANDDVQWNDRRHFFGAAAKAMRQILVDDARKRKSLKRGGERSDPAFAFGANSSPPARSPVVFESDPAEVLAIHEGLDRLALHDPRKAEVVMLRYFAGLTVDETAQALEVSPRTVDSDWSFARAWLYRELGSGDAGVVVRRS